MKSRDDADPGGFEAMRTRRPRPSLSDEPRRSNDDGSTGMDHDGLVAALRSIDGLVDVGHDPPNFRFRGRRGSVPQSRR